MFYKLFNFIAALMILPVICVYSQPNPVSLKDVKTYLVRGGEWVSLRPELRPAEDRQGTGKIQPFYISRSFKYFDNDTFEGRIISYADPFGKLPLVEFVFKGRIEFKGEHEIAIGAYEIDYILDEAFDVTPLHPMFAENLNQIPVPGLNKWEVGVRQNILKKPFPLFNIKEGQIVADYDLVFIYNDMLFMGAKHVDGRGFDKPENRPTNLQIPLVRKNR